MLGHYLGHNEVFKSLNYNSSAYTVLLVYSFESWLPSMLVLNMSVLNKAILDFRKAEMKTF